MKNIKRLILLVFVVLLTGCANYNMSMRIDKDKSMLFSIVILSDNQSEINNDIVFLSDKYEKYGFVISEYNQNNGYGVMITKEFDNIDDISFGKRSDEFDLLYFYENDYDSDVEKNMFNVDKGFYTNRYAANFVVDLSKYVNLNNSIITYSVYLPNGSVNNNANIVSDDGNTLTWNISLYGKNDIDFVFELRSYDNVYYAIAIIIVIVLLFLIIKNLFGKNDENDNLHINSSNGYGLNKDYSNYGQNKIISNVNKNKVNSDSDNISKKMDMLTKKSVDSIGLEKNDSNSSILSVPVIPKNEDNLLNINQNSNDMDIFEVPVDLKIHNVDNDSSLDDEKKNNGPVIRVNNQDIVTKVKDSDNEM